MIVINRRRPGFSLVSLSLVCIIIMVCLGFSLSAHNLNKISDDELKAFALALDTALSIWYQFHAGYYPDSLQLLRDAKVIPDKSPIESFAYSTTDNQTAYVLTVTLSSGAVWITPGSKTK